MKRILASVLLGVSLLCRVSFAQTEEETPRRYGISGDFDWSFSNSDNPWLNPTAYGNDLMRLLRVSLNFNFRVSERVGVYVNFTSENAETPHVYGAFIRLAPWGGDKLWLQAGKIPPPFGAFPERWYALANPLIGLPLMYDYRTSLRADHFPRNTDDLLRHRGAGLGSRSAQEEGYGDEMSEPYPPGMPMVSLLKWDTGVVAFGSFGRLDYVAGITNGTLSNPQVVDGNGGKQFLGRTRFRFSPAFEAGFSAARGPYLDRSVEPYLRAGDLEDFNQTIVGADAHFARGHLLLYTEGAWTRWETPRLNAQPLDAWSGFIEARYRLWPGIYVAGRADRISFSQIQVAGGEPEPWDFPLSRLEVGAGYSWERNVVLKFVFQVNRFQEASVLDEDIAAFQIAVHF